MEKSGSKMDRRGFLKSGAVIPTLAVLGVIAAAPANAAPWHCAGTCKAECADGCNNDCRGDCMGSCEGKCGGCDGTCTGSCSDTAKS